MTTTTTTFDGTTLIVPAANDFVWPHPSFSGFPECCGPGPGVGNKAVPESILGMKVSPACWVHDWMWNNGENTWSNFHYSNAVFLCNLLEINEARGGNVILKTLRKPLILGWFTAVASIVGARNFFGLGK